MFGARVVLYAEEEFFDTYCLNYTLLLNYFVLFSEHLYCFILTLYSHYISLFLPVCVKLF